MVQECIFCKIGSGEVESEILYRGDNCFVIKDIAPKAPVHLLVIPERHFENLTDLTQEHYPMIGSMFKTAQEVATSEGAASTGYRLTVNQGRDSGQVVAHLHLHVLGGRPLRGMG